MSEHTLGEREAEVMQVLWDIGSGTVAEVRERLDVPLAYTTVLTVLRNLAEKGLAAAVVEGRAHRYVPLVRENEIRSSAVKRLVRSLFGGSRDALLAHLIGEEQLSARQLERVRELIEKRKDASGEES
jgi:BlaI family transcriptional regulator, penicillinase repressor